MGKKSPYGSNKITNVGKQLTVVSTRVIYCGDKLEQLNRKIL